MTASVGYDSANRLVAASYANATSLRVDDDPLGRRSALMFTDSAATRLVGHSVITSSGGRRADEAIDTGGAALVDPNPVGTNFTYALSGPAAVGIARLRTGAVVHRRRGAPPSAEGWHARSGVLWSRRCQRPTRGNRE